MGDYGKGKGAAENVHKNESAGKNGNSDHTVFLFYVFKKKKMYLRRNNKTKLEVSIDEPLNVDWDGNELLLSDILGTDEDVIYRDIETEVEKKLLNKAIEHLSGRERTIIELRFGINSKNDNELTQKEVADLLGISQSYISRLEKKIMKRLKKEIVRFE